MNDGPAGQKNYRIVLQSARVAGHPIGPQYHVYDKHLKKWQEKNNKTDKKAPEVKIKNGKPFIDGLSAAETEAILIELELLRIDQGVLTPQVSKNAKPVTKVKSTSWVTGEAKKKIG